MPARMGRGDIKSTLLFIKIEVTCYKDNFLLYFIHQKCITWPYPVLRKPENTVSVSLELYPATSQMALLLQGRKS